MLKKKCLFCGKEIIKKPSHSMKVWKNQVKYCSRSCFHISLRGKSTWNKGLTKETDERVKSGADVLKEKYKNNEIQPSGCCSKEYVGSKLFLERCSKGGGYRENAGRSKKFKVKDSFGKTVTLQSSYELKCSEILNELNIKWIRPNYLNYFLNNIDAQKVIPYTYPIIKFFYERIYETRQTRISKGGESFNAHWKRNGRNDF